MLLPDFIATQFFKNRRTTLKSEDITNLTKAINGVIEVFSQVSSSLQGLNNRAIVKSPIKLDDTFN